MPSIRAPRIVIYEFFKAIAAAIGPTSLPSCIIGPLYKLYKNKFLANYNNELINVDLDLGTGINFDYSYTKFKISNFTSSYNLPIILKSISGATAISASQTIEFTSTKTPIRVGDWVRIKNPILLKGDYKITKVKITEAGLHTIWLNTTILTDTSVDIDILYLYPENTGTIYTIPGYITIDDKYEGKTAHLNSPSYTTIEVESTDKISVGDTIDIYASSNQGALPLGLYLVLAVDYSLTTPLITINHVNSGADVTISFTVIMGNTIPVGKLYANYRGLDTTKTDLIEIANITELQNNFGDIDIDNPLVFGMYFALLSSTVGIKGFAIPSDDATGYDYHTNLWDKRDIYCIVPLTYSNTVKSSYKTKVESLNDPQKGKVLRDIFAEEVTRYLSIYTGNKDDLVTSGNAFVDGTTTFDIFFNTASTIPWGQITINQDKIKIINSDIGYGNRLNGEYLIVNKDIANRKLTVQGKLGVTSIPASSVVSFDFEILHFSTLSEVAEKLANDGESLFNRAHSQIIGNVFAEIDGVETEIPTYYAACGLAGLISTMPPQQQFNGFNIPGIIKVKNTWDLFNDDQLSIIAGGGNIVLIQDGPGSVPYIRNQLTTDTTSVLTRSLNIGRCVDYTKKLIFSEIKLFLTGYNAIPSTAELITFRVNAIISFLKRFTVPRAGSVILGGKITKIEIIDNAISVDLKMVYPKPLEEIDFNLYVE